LPNLRGLTGLGQKGSLTQTKSKSVEHKTKTIKEKDEKSDTTSHREVLHAINSLRDVLQVHADSTREIAGFMKEMGASVKIMSDSIGRLVQTQTNMMPLKEFLMAKGNSILVTPDFLPGKAYDPEDNLSEYLDDLKISNVLMVNNVDDLINANVHERNIISLNSDAKRSSSRHAHSDTSEKVAEKDDNENDNNEDD